MSDLKNGDLAMIQFTGSTAPPVLARFNTDREEVASWDPEFKWCDPHEYWSFFGSEICAHADEVEVGARVYLTSEEPT